MLFEPPYCNIQLNPSVNLIVFMQFIELLVFLAEEQVLLVSGNIVIPNIS